MQLLLCLNETYIVVRGHILLINPIPIVGKVFFSTVERRKMTWDCKFTIFTRFYCISCKNNNPTSKFSKLSPNNSKFIYKGWA